MKTDLPSPGFLQLQLKLKDIWQRRSLGQHFLFNEKLLARIADAAGLDFDTLAVEIGPGAGTLTTMLAARAGAVLAVETDERLRPIHEDAFAPCRNRVRFQYDDALRIDLPALAKAESAARGLSACVLTGNLPFQITSPLLFAQCGPQSPWRRIAVMVQSEVADRIASPPGRKAYGILSVKLAYWWRVVERFAVPAGSFEPRPNVDAAVVVFEPLPADALPPAEVWPSLSSFVDAAFGQRRKMLVNSLAGRWGPNPGKEPTRAALARMGLDETVRAEQLDPAGLRRLHALLRPGIYPGALESGPPKVP
jgi:16S rRNA (adenine1518-N6/adenine1519-N6)-dimethyltransferase